MNFMKKLFIVAFAFTLPLMSMQNGMDLKKALQVFGFTKGTVTKEQMKTRFFELAKKCHPDQSGGDKNKATHMMQELVNARDALKEAEYPINVEKPVKQARYQSWNYQSNSNSYSSYSSPQMSEEDLFCHAVINDKVAEVETLLKKNKNFANSFFEGEAVLFHALSRGNPTILKLLVDAGANLKIKTSLFAFTPLMYAIKICSSPSVIELLLEYGVDANEASGLFGTPLICLVRSTISNENKILIIKMLLKYGVDLENESFPYGTVLNYAVFSDNETIVKFLLDAGARSFTPGGPVFEKAKPKIYSLFIERFQQQQQIKKNIFQKQVDEYLSCLQEVRKQSEQNNAVYRYYRSFFHYSTQNKSHVEEFFKAIHNGDLKKLTAILNGNPKFVNTSFGVVPVWGGIWKGTPLMTALQSDTNIECRLAMARLLLLHGADVDEVCGQYNKKLLYFLLNREHNTDDDRAKLARLFLNVGARTDIDNHDWIFVRGKELSELFEEELCGPLPQRSKL